MKGPLPGPTRGPAPINFNESNPRPTIFNPMN